MYHFVLQLSELFFQFPILCDCSRQCCLFILQFARQMTEILKIRFVYTQIDTQNGSTPFDRGTGIRKKFFHIYSASNAKIAERVYGAIGAHVKKRCSCTGGSVQEKCVFSLDSKFAFAIFCIHTLRTKLAFRWYNF